MRLFSSLKRTVFLLSVVCLPLASHAAVFTFTSTLSLVNSTGEAPVFEIYFANQSPGPNPSPMLVSGVTSAQVGQTFLVTGQPFNELSAGLTSGDLDLLVYGVTNSHQGVFRDTSESHIFWGAPVFPFQPAANGAIDLAGYTINSISVTIDAFSATPSPLDRSRNDYSFTSTLTVDVAQSVPDSATTLFLLSSALLALGGTRYVLRRR